jgi:trigger factor
MSSQVSEISPVEVEVKCEIPWERVQKGLEDQYSRLQKQAKVRGFRPGKVPRNVLKQLYGAQVKSEVVAALVEEALLAAVREHELMPVATPSVDAPQLAEGETYKFVAKMEIKPKVEDVKTDGLVITRPSAEVADADVAQEIDRLREMNATHRVLDPARPSKEGDSLIIHYSVTIDGEAKPDMSATDRPVELGAGKLIPEFETGLLGLQPGDKKKIDVKFADDHGREDLRGKTAVFEIEVKEMREKILPEVDDEFAKDCGDFATLLELRLDIRKKLEEAAKRRVEAEIRDQAVDKLVEANPIPVPPSLIEGQERAMMQELAQFLSYTGQDAPMTEELHKSMHVRAERKVRAAILFGEIARKESLRATAQDVDAKLAQLAERSGKHIAKIRVEYQGEKREALENQILEEKILDWLVSRAKIEESKEAAAATKEAEE